MEEHQSSPREAGPARRADPLWRAFVDPPDEARPRAWWHWMDGNVDPAGIGRDLEWLHDVGVRGVQMFDGGMGTPLVVPAPVRPGSEAWDEAVRHGQRTAHGARPGVRRRHLRGLERRRRAVGRARRRDEEGRLVGDRRRAVAGRRGAAPAPAGRAGPVPGLPRAGAPTATASVRHRLARARGPRRPVALDVCCPTPSRASAPSATGPAWSTDRSAARIALPRDPDGSSTAWIEQVFDEPVTVGSVTVGLPGPRGFGAAPPASAVLQASDDGVAYRDVARAADRRHPGPHGELPRRHRAPVPARALGGQRRGRAAAGGGRRAPPPVLRTVDTFAVSEFALRAGGRVHRAEVKAGFGAAADYFALPTDPRVDDGVGRSDHGRRPDRSRARRRPALGRAPGRLAGPALRRLAHRPDQRTRARRRDRPRGRQARRRAGSRVPRHLPRAVRDRATATRRRPRAPLRRAAERQHRVRPAELHRGDPRPLRTPARLRPGAVAARAGRLPRRRARRSPTASSTTTGARSPSCSPTSTTARSRRRRIGGAWPTTPRRSRTAGRSSATTSPCARTPTSRWARCGRSTPSAARSRRTSPT